MVAGRVSIVTAAASEGDWQEDFMSTTEHLTTEVPPSQDWRDLLEDILPPQGSWSEEQYLVLTDYKSRLIEFTDGFLEVLPVPTDQHQNILEFLFLAFLQFIKPRGG